MPVPDLPASAHLPDIFAHTDQQLLADCIFQMREVSVKVFLMLEIRARRTDVLPWVMMAFIALPSMF